MTGVQGSSVGEAQSERRKAEWAHRARRVSSGRCERTFERSSTGRRSDEEEDGDSDGGAVWRRDGDGEMGLGWRRSELRTDEGGVARGGCRSGWLLGGAADEKRTGMPRAG